MRCIRGSFEQNLILKYLRDSDRMALDELHEYSKEDIDLYESVIGHLLELSCSLLRNPLAKSIFHR